MDLAEKASKLVQNSVNKSYSLRSSNSSLSFGQNSPQSNSQVNRSSKASKKKLQKTKISHILGTNLKNQSQAGQNSTYSFRNSTLKRVINATSTKKSFSKPLETNPNIKNSHKTASIPVDLSKTISTDRSSSSLQYLLGYSASNESLVELHSNTLTTLPKPTDLNVLDAKKTSNKMSHKRNPSYRTNDITKKRKNQEESPVDTKPQKLQTIKFKSFDMNSAVFKDKNTTPKRKSKPGLKISSISYKYQPDGNLETTKVWNPQNHDVWGSTEMNDIDQLTTSVMNNPVSVTHIPNVNSVMFINQYSNSFDETTLTDPTDLDHPKPTGEKLKKLTKIPETSIAIPRSNTDAQSFEPTINENQQYNTQNNEDISSINSQTFDSPDIFIKPVLVGASSKDSLVEKRHLLGQAAQTNDKHFDSETIHNPTQYKKTNTANLEDFHLLNQPDTDKMYLHKASRSKKLASYLSKKKLQKNPAQNTDSDPSGKLISAMNTAPLDYYRNHFSSEESGSQETNKSSASEGSYLNHDEISNINAVTEQTSTRQDDSRALATTIPESYQVHISNPINSRKSKDRPIRRIDSRILKTFLELASKHIQTEESQKNELVPLEISNSASRIKLFFKDILPEEPLDVHSIDTDHFTASQKKTLGINKDLPNPDVLSDSEYADKVNSLITSSDFDSFDDIKLGNFQNYLYLNTLTHSTIAGYTWSALEKEHFFSGLQKFKYDIPNVQSCIGPSKTVAQVANYLQELERGYIHLLNSHPELLKPPRALYSTESTSAEVQVEEYYSLASAIEEDRQHRVKKADNVIFREFKFKVGDKRMRFFNIKRANSLLRNIYGNTDCFVSKNAWNEYYNLIKSFLEKIIANLLILKEPSFSEKNPITKNNIIDTLELMGIESSLQPYFQKLRKNKGMGELLFNAYLFNSDMDDKQNDRYEVSESD